MRTFLLSLLLSGSLLSYELLLGGYYLVYKSYQRNACGGPSLPPYGLVVARHELLPGNTVEPEDLAVIETWVLLDEGIFRSPEQIVGLVPIERVLPGEPIRVERFADPEAGVGLNGVLPRGTRAVRIPLGASIAGPGDPVDLLITRSAGTETLLEDEIVRAIVEDEAVLAVPTSEVKRVQEALSNGRPTLVLRSALR